jgi:hypothetical protein
MSNFREMYFPERIEIHLPKLLSQSGALAHDRNEIFHDLDGNYVPYGVLCFLLKLSCLIVSITECQKANLIL